MWSIEDTWAHTAGLVQVREPADLLKCTFFDWDAILFDLESEAIVAGENYFQLLAANVLDINLEENPNPRGSLVRARAVHQHVDDEGLRAIQHERALTRDPTPPTMKAPPGTPYDCNAPGYSGGKPKTVWAGPPIHGRESGPRRSEENFFNNFRELSP